MEGQVLRIAFVSVAILAVGVGTVSGQSVNVRLPAPSSTSPAPAVAAAAGATVDQAVSVAEIRALARDTREALQDFVLRGALDPAITGRNNAPVQAISLEVGKDGETVGKAKLSWRLDDYDSAVDIILKGPINQSSGVPITDRGLASGASVTLGYNLTLWGSSVAAATDSVVQSRIAAAAAGQSLNSLEAVIATGLAVQSATAPVAGTREANRQWYGDATLQSLAEDRTWTAFTDRDPRRIAFALQENGTARLTRTLSLRGSYGVGSTTFKFAEIADPIVEKSDTKSDNAAAISVAYVQLLRDGAAEAPLMLISGGYTQSDRWRAGRTRQICTPLNIGSATECRSLVVGAPTKLTEKSVEIDIRSWAYAQKLGINPHFSYDRLTKKWTSEVALSFLVLKDPVNGVPQLDAKALTVGLRVGSRPEEDGGVYAAVFFGTVLSK
jgi:hypothetical protein